MGSCRSWPNLEIGQKPTAGIVMYKPTAHQQIDRFRLKINDFQEIWNYAHTGFVTAFAELWRTRGFRDICTPLYRRVPVRAPVNHTDYDVDNVRKQARRHLYNTCWMLQEGEQRRYSCPLGNGIPSRHVCTGRRDTCSVRFKF